MRVMRIDTKDKKIIRILKKHFKFGLEDAIEVFRYAQEKSKTLEKWLKSNRDIWEESCLSSPKEYGGVMRHRIGTLKCMLFGHTLISELPHKENDGYVIRTLSTFCSRCGIKREEIYPKSDFQKEG